ncbi:hypothetical protein JJB09_18480 [Rhizobium sp. KVB221]|uniref:Uncharacterized protein n=1 Tax=Rhizobium setariae TaxID=2801340 RepID=A0A936YV18_9HYPH|nr:hypothetical protein [Rhizobium setariae]MBL0374011.1 hypothetical protein [Rhizobium setariae]
MTAKQRAGEAMPANIRTKYHDNQAIDNVDFAIDLIRTSRLALHANTETGLVDDEDIASIGYVLTYALDTLNIAHQQLSSMQGGEG